MAILPRGYVNKFVSMDCETSGLSFDHSNPDITDGFQSLAWGIIVTDLKTLKPIDELYVEIKWDGVSGWHWKAEKTHGLTKEYLEKHGMEEEDAAGVIAQFLLKHFDFEDTIVCMGANVTAFDIPFLKKLLYKYGYMFSISARSIDCSGMGMVFLETFTTQQMFDLLNVRRATVHNALEDARAVLTSVRKLRALFDRE